MLPHIQSFVSIVTLLSIITKTFAISPRPTACPGVVTTFKYCDNIDRILKECNVLTGKQESIDCFCTQELLDSYVG